MSPIKNSTPVADLTPKTERPDNRPDQLWVVANIQNTLDYIAASNNAIDKAIEVLEFSLKDWKCLLRFGQYCHNGKASIVQNIKGHHRTLRQLRKLRS